MTYDSAHLKQTIAEMALLIERNDDPEPHIYALFFQHPEYALDIINLINMLDEDQIEEGPPIYSACIFALDICIAQLQAGTEANNKVTEKSLNLVMSHLAKVINAGAHGLSFWLPVLNAFYEVHVDLNQALKDAYFNLASHEELDTEDMDQASHLDAIKDLILELSDLSIFDIAEHFFAQSYAMPADFFADLIVDLYSIPEGQDIAILILLHPKMDVRQIAVAALDQLMDQVTLTSASLTRLQVIKYWYPESYYAIFDRWIKTQRKKGVVFEPEPKLAQIGIKATEVDGTGAQGIFIHARRDKKNRLCGLLYKYEQGVKDVWVTPIIPAKEVRDYYRQAFEESVTLREVDFDYLKLMTEHFLSLTLANNDIPNLHFLEIQELLGVRFRPVPLDMDYLINQLSVQISPFTPEVIKESLVRSKSWLKSKQFTESWYIENPVVDKIVNHNSSFVDGVKVCRLAEAMESVFTEEIEMHRSKWQFHFLWVALWIKAKARKNEKAWQDSFLIAYAIHQGQTLHEIPVMVEICRQTVINSVETMQERRTHLSKE